MKVPKYSDERLMFGMILSIANKLQMIGDRMYDEITMKQFVVLIMLKVFEEEHPTLNELANQVGSSHQNVKQLVLKLQEKGYLKMYEDAEDKRKKRICLTNKWEQEEVKYKKLEEKHMRTLFENVDRQELKQAVKVMLQLTKNLEEMNENESKSSNDL